MSTHFSFNGAIASGLLLVHGLVFSLFIGGMLDGSDGNQCRLHSAGPRLLHTPAR